MPLREINSELKQMPFQAPRYHSLGRPQEATCTNRNAHLTNKKRIINLFRIFGGELLAINCRDMWTIKKKISTKCKWTWNDMYQNLYDRAKNIIKENVTMTFYNERKELYQETDALGLGLGGSLKQTMDGMWFPRNEALTTQHCSQKHLQAKAWQMHRPTTAA